LTTFQIIIYSTEKALSGTYLICYDVALDKYPSNKKTAGPFKVTVTKPPMPPTLSGLTKNQVNLNAEIPDTMQTMLVFIGKPTDLDNDPVLVAFQNNG
jgi:hypothetical protein